MLLKEIIGKYIFVLWYIQLFKVRQKFIKKNIGKYNYIKIKNLCSSKMTKRIKTQFSN